MSLSRFSSLLRQSVRSSGNTQPLRLYSGTKKEQNFFQRNSLNLVGLPVVAFILFVILPTFTPGEIHSVDWYDEQYVKETKAKEAARAAAKAAAAAAGEQGK